MKPINGYSRKNDIPHQKKGLRQESEAVTLNHLTIVTLKAFFSPTEHKLTNSYPASTILTKPLKPLINTRNRFIF